MIHELEIKWAMSSGVLKCMVHVLQLCLDSRHMQSFGLPDLSLPSMSMKLLTHRVASLTGLMIPAWNILSISFLKASFRLNGYWPAQSLFWCDVHIDLYVVWQTGNLLIPSNMSRYFDNICSLLVIVMPGFSFWTVFIDADIDTWLGGSCLWADTSCFDQWTFKDVNFVLLGWSIVLVIRLAHGGR